jgi:LAO/AO transport system kinase
MSPWSQQILSGDLRALARAATAIENRNSQADALLRELFPHTGHAITIGITGAPGAGKSTLVDKLTHILRQENKSVGVIAVDPTSPYTGGAILGDRIRMLDHHADPQVFIRSMATRGWQGGVAAATTDMAVLLDAAGKDVVLIETVGVGQDEVEIAKLAAVTVVVLVPGMGDDVQAIKAGIMEIADVFVINKADQPEPDRLEREIKAIQSLSTRHDGWVPPIVKTIAVDGQGISETLAAIRSFLAHADGKDRAVSNWTQRLREMLRERLLHRFPDLDFHAAAEEIVSRRSDPYTIIDTWLRGAGPRPAE